MFKNRNLQSFGATLETQRLGLIDFLEEVEGSLYLEKELSDEQIAEIAEAISDWPSSLVVHLWNLLKCEYNNSVKLHRAARDVLVGSVLGWRDNV